MESCRRHRHLRAANPHHHPKLPSYRVQSSHLLMGFQSLLKSDIHSHSTTSKYLQQYATASSNSCKLVIYRRVQWLARVTNKNRTVHKMLVPAGVFYRVSKIGYTRSETLGIEKAKLISVIPHATYNPKSYCHPENIQAVFSSYKC